MSEVEEIDGKSFNTGAAMAMLAAGTHRVQMSDATVEELRNYDLVTNRQDGVVTFVLRPKKEAV